MIFRSSKNMNNYSYRPSMGVESGNTISLVIVNLFVIECMRGVKFA